MQLRKQKKIRNTKRLWVLLATFYYSCHFSDAHAQWSLPAPMGEGIDLQLYRPPLNHLGLLGIESAETVEPGGASFSLGFTRIQQPLSLTYAESDPGVETTLPVVDSLTLSHIQLAAGLLPWLELGASMPLLVDHQALHPVSGQALTGVYPGDVRVYARTALLPARPGLPAVGVLLPLSIPTGSPNAWVGESAVTFAPALLVGRSRERIGWSLSLGARIRQPTALRYEPAGATLTVGSEVVGGAAVELEATQGLRVGVGLEGLVVQVEDLDGDRFERRVEGRVGVRHSLPFGLMASLGGAVGLSSGYGVPVWELFGGLSWRYGASGPEVRDTDRDGLADDLDRCIDQTEDIDFFEDDDGCPELDNDKDGLPDAQDQCPIAPETINLFYDEDGCPEPDRDADLVPDLKDPCPDHPEDLDGFLDEDGCPEVDADRDAVPDDTDRCPLEPEDPDSHQDADGCPDPDNDLDGILDAQDRCPLEAPDAPFVEGQTAEGEGCPPKPPPQVDRIELRPEEDDLAPAMAKASHALDDFDQDAVPDVQDLCPRKPETPNGFQDQDGCPEADRDLDGILDKKDRCPRTAETLNGYRDLDGCPDQLPVGFEAPEMAPPVPQDGAERAGSVSASALESGGSQGPGTTPVESVGQGAGGEATQGAARSPDADGDGLPDSADLCPRLPELWNGVRDEDGCPEKDTDRDGIIDLLDRCKTLRESLNGVEDSDGCPEKDRDRDGIPDPVDACPGIPETANGFQDKDGCWDALPPPAAPVSGAGG